MPFDPNFPFMPGDPAQWWRARTLPRIVVQPNAPPNAASGDPAGSDGIDDWFVPGQSPGRIAPWSPGTDHFFPDDWIYPDNRNASNSAAAPSSGPPTPSPQPDAANPAISNRPAPAPDPFAAYWSLIPASRVGALAWAAPIFPNSFGQFPSTTPAPPPLSLPSIPTGGLLGGIPKMLAAQAAANDPWANGILGGIPKMLAASAPPSPLSAAGSRGILGALANLQPAPSAAPADAAYLPGWRPFLPPDPIGYPGSNPSYAYLRNDLLGLADLREPGPDQLQTDETFGATPYQENASPNVLLIHGDEEEEKEHDKPDPAVLGGLTDRAPTAPLKAQSPLQLPLPFFPRPSLPPTSAPQPPPPRASLPPPPSSPPGTLSSPSPGQAGNSPRASATPIGRASALAPAGPESDAGSLGGAGATARGVSSLTTIGKLGRSSTPTGLDWRKLIEGIKDALSAGLERFQPGISAALPKYEPEGPTYGVLITNEGDVVLLKSADPNPLYKNYRPAGHVEGKAALWIREHGSTGGVVYHNNTDGTCGPCNSQIETLLPKGAILKVFPPPDAIAKNRWARQGPTKYKGNADVPTPPRPDPQPDFFKGQQP